ncbi:hypothetical protein DFH09DRAFT_1154028 [Mycena vulgaris]|nr:hypothetical protein DFH09DRAFT_1154028 [Mycena vulgaris]
MRFALTVTVALALSGATVAFTPTSRGAPTWRDGLTHLRKATDPAPLPPTNAGRLARGLPLLKPRHHASLHPAPARRSPTLPVLVRCNLYATVLPSSYQFVDGRSPTYNLGYLVGTHLGFYGAYKQPQLGALEVSFMFFADSPDQLTLKVLNSTFPSYPYFGGIVGYKNTGDDLSSATTNIAYIGGTTQIAADSPPVRGGGNSFSYDANYNLKSETAIWSPQWINTGGGSPVTTLAYSVDSGEMYITGVGSDRLGDLASVAGNSLPVSLTCVTPLATGQ